MSIYHIIHHKSSGSTVLKKDAAVQAGDTLSYIEGAIFGKCIFFNLVRRLIINENGLREPPYLTALAEMNLNFFL